MSGKPAARITDSVVYGTIVTGSATVLIGSQAGIACSVCPGGMKVGSPVNPQLGAKVLMGESELDFALPGAMPVVWQRQYSSYVNPEQGGACGLLGYGWKLPQELRIRLQAKDCLLLDTAGRSIRYDALEPGQSHYSISEDIWLLRGGCAQAGDALQAQAGSPGADANAGAALAPDVNAGAPWAKEPRWAHIPVEFSGNSQCILVASGNASTLWVFAPDSLLAGDYHLVGQIDRLGRSQRYGRNCEGRIERMQDGTGRQYRLHHARLHAGHEGQGLWQADSGWRLTGVELVHDPMSEGMPPLAGQAPLMLVRYGYSGAGDLVSVHDRHGQQLREFSYRNHLLVAHRLRQGPRHSYRYENDLPGAKVLEQCNEEGLDYQFSYRNTSQGKATRVRDSLGRMDTYCFEGEGGLSRLTEHHRADGSVVKSQYNSHGQLVARTDPLGHTLQLRLDGMGRLLGTQGPQRNQHSWSYDEVTGLLQARTDAAGRSTRYSYDRWQRLTEVTLPDGSSQQYAYPEPGPGEPNSDRPIRITDAKGGVQQLQYNRAGLPTVHTDCSGQTTRRDYGCWGELNSITNALGARTRYEYNALGQLSSIHHPGGGQTHYRYDSQGRVVTLLGGDAQKHSNVQMEYDLWGRLQKRWHAGHMLVFAYDAAGRLQTLENENHAVMRFHWDEMDRLVQESGFDGRVQGYRYDAAGQLIESRDGLAMASDLPEQHTRYDWSATGQLLKRSLPATAHSAAQEQHFEWAADGALLAASLYSLQDGQALLQSQALIERDSLGRGTGEIQRLYKVQPGQPEVEFEHQIHHKFDALGHRLSSQLQGCGEIGYLLYGSGHVHGLTHNGEPLLDWERDGLHRETGRQLHLPGHLQRRESPPLAGNTTGLRRSQSWDPVGQLQNRQIHGLQGLDGQDLPPRARALTQQQYHYDSVGQLMALETPQGRCVYFYDEAGRLTGAQTPQAGPRHWHYDPAGNRLPRGSGAVGPQGPHAPGWAEQVKSQWRDTGFDLLQSDAMQANGANVGLERWVDNRVGYYITGQEGTSTAATGLTHYRYDACGNRVQSTTRLLDRQGEPERSTSLLFNADQQLTGLEIEANPAQGGARIQHSYRYDVFGRRLARYCQVQGQAPSIEYYGWDGDQLVHTERLVSNAGGDTERQLTHTVYEPGSFTPLLHISQQDQTLQSPTQELLDHITDPDATAHLVRLLRDIPALQSQLKSNQQKMGMDAGLMKATLGQLQTLQEQKEKSHQQRQRSLEVRHYLCDHLGTPQALVNQQGEIDWLASYDPWGNLLEEFNPGNLQQDIRLPGQHHDRDSGLHYNRHRYYDPQLGAYVNQDPIKLDGGTNFYRYPGNPNTWIDPLGLQSFGPNFMGVGTQQRASLGMHMLGQGATPEEISLAIYGKPPGFEGAVSLEAAIGGQAVAGGSGALGLTVGKAREDCIPKACIYFTTCQTLGAGASGGIDANLSISNAPPSTGVVKTVGIFGSGGVLGKGNGAVLSEIGKPSNVTTSMGVGVGGGASGGLMTCQQYSLCTP